MSANSDPVAVRNVILVAGFDYEDPSRSFDDLAFARIHEIFEQQEHLRYPLRFHLFSAEQGIAAESVVFDRSYGPGNAGDFSTLEAGDFWLRVDPRFAPVTVQNYRQGLFSDPAGRFEEQALEDKPALSITDVYRYLHGFWEGAQETSRERPTAYDVLLELSFFAHATPGALLLLHSVGEGGPAERDPRDKDGRATDFTRFSPVPRVGPEEFWGRIARMFDRAAGRVRIWGGRASADTLLHASLIRDTLDSLKPGGRWADLKTAARAPRIGAAPPNIDATPIKVSRSNVRAALGREADALTFGRVKALLAAARDKSYAAAVQRKLNVSTYAPPLGTTTQVEQKPGNGGGQILLEVPKSLEDIVEFHQVAMKLTIDREGRRYGILGPAPKALPPEQKNAISPLAGFRPWRPYASPFRRDQSRDIERDPTLQRLLEEALRNAGLDYSGDALKRPAIAIADVSGTAPYPYAATSNHARLYYSASMLKVVALFGLAHLRTMIRTFDPQLTAVLGEKSVSESLALFSPYLSPVIDRAADFSRTKIVKKSAATTLAWRHRVPDFAESLEPTVRPWDVNVDREDDVEQLLSDADHSDEPAGRIIRRLGYAWITGTTRSSGFPEIWLAGDYSQGVEPPRRGARDESFPAAKIRSQNDGLSAQATSVRDMAALFARIATADPDKASRSEKERALELSQVRKWLAGGAGAVRHSYLERHPRILPFVVSAAKLGLGPKESHFASEAAFITRMGTDRKFVVVFANATDENENADNSINKVADAIVETLHTYSP